MLRSRVFRSIWRINAVMILVIGLLSLGLFAFVAYEALKERFQSLHRDDLVNVDPHVHIDSNWELGSFEHIAGTNVAAAPVHSSQRFRLAVREKDAEAVRNYLFLDLYDKSSRWLLPNHDRLILNKREICGATSEKGWQPCLVVAWLAFESVTQDTNGDHRLTSKDRLTLGFSNSDGGNYRDVLSGVDTIRSTIQRDSDTMIVVYSAGGKDSVAEISIPKRTVTETKALPPVGKT